MRSIQRNGAAVSVMDRVSRLLDAYAADRAELSLAQLTRCSGLPKTTVHRLLAELEGIGFVERHEGSFRLGMRLFELGQLVPRQRTLRDAALPFMEDLREVTRQTVHLAVLDGPEVVYVEILRGAQQPPLPSRVGGRMPAYCTGVGKALLAHAEPDVVAAVLAGGLPRRTPYTITSPAALERQLEEVRRTGTAHDHEESGLNFACTASPVTGADGRVVAAISVTGRLPMLRAERTAPAVHTAALALSRALRTS
jgi:IclR family transcriptional regulator, acetate operon repressor